MNFWGDIFSELFLVGLLSAAVRLGTPILLAALGEIVVEESGVLNIGIEGEMLVGALAGFLGAYYFQNVGAGFVLSIICGALMGLIMAFLVVTLRCDQIVTGIALNIFALGLTSFLYRLVFGTSLIPPILEEMSALEIPLLREIPIVGKMFFSQNVIVYIALLLVFLLWFINSKTSVGLYLKAAGEFPLAAETMGIKVLKIRYGALLFGGAMAGLGGSFLSLGQLSMFSENMAAGRGFIALAMVIFGRWDPLRVWGAALLFGGADALQMRLQGVGVRIPYQFMLMLPYLLSLVVLVGMKGKSRPPAALGVPYYRD